MKKIFIVLLFLVIANSLSAQKIHFCDTSNKWITINYDFYTHIYGRSYYQIYPFGFIESHMYYDLNINIFNIGLGGWTTGDIQIREDTIAKIVYYWDFDSTGSEKILYNYNLHAGDTFHLHVNSISNWMIDSVIGVDSVLIGFYYYKKFTVKEIDTFYPHQPGWDTVYTYMEGFGSLFRPVNNQPYSPSIGLQEYLECFTNSGVMPVVDSIPYFYPSLVDTLYFLNDCAAVGISKGGPGAGRGGCNVNVSPNPATKLVYLTINSPQWPSGSVITAYNLSGQQVYRIITGVTGNTIEVNTTDWIDGVYLFMVQTEGGITYEKVEVRK